MENTFIRKETIFNLNNALDQLKESFEKMEEEWTNCENDSSYMADKILVPDFPFNESFDDLLGEVRTWVGLCKGRLLTALVEIIKDEDSRSLRKDA